VSQSDAAAAAIVAEEANVADGDVVAAEAVQIKRSSYLELLSNAVCTCIICCCKYGGIRKADNGSGN